MLRRVAFFRLVQGPLAELRASGDVIGRIVRREIDGVIARGVVDPSRAEAVVQALEGGALAVPRRRFAREFEAFAIGPCLDQAEHGTEAYFDAVPTFERAASEVLGNEVEANLAAALAALAEPRPIVTPRSAAGRSYGRFSLRCLPPGGLIPPHAENEHLLRPPYDDLRPQLDPQVILSFYLTLAPAETGGELAVHAFGFDELDRTSMRDRHSQVGDALAHRERFAMKPRAGDLLLFDGGRNFHQVLPVGGAANRWTMGGFVALSANGAQVLAWA